MAFHKNLTGLDIHTLVAWTFDDAGTRTSYSYSLADIGKMAMQADDNSFWLVTDVAGTAATFQGVGAGGGDDSLANHAYSIAIAGTNSANYAYSIAIAGTDSANAAYAIGRAGLETAWTGTRLDTLSDVTITTPVASQSLVFNGNKWINESVVTASPGGYTYYYDSESVSALTGFRNILPFPTGDFQPLYLTGVGGVGSAVEIVDQWVSGTFNRTFLNAGTWGFNHYLQLSGFAVNPVVLAWDVCTVSSAGAENFWFSGSSVDVTNLLTSSLYTTQISVNSRAVDRSDRLLVRAWACRNNPVPATLGFYVYSPDVYTFENSHFSAPFGVAHNDLFGLQGGPTGEYYHVSKNQLDAAGGSSGSPSLANRFVTEDDPTLQSGAEALAVATTALTTAWTGTRLDTLSDVTITSPLAAQNLVYDGSKWINSDPTSVASPTFYTGFYDDTPSVIPGFNTFTQVPSGLPEVVDTVNVGGANRGKFIEAYLTGTLARTYLSPGIWTFNHYASVDNATRPVSMTWDVFVRTVAGAEQFWFSGTSTSIATTTVTHDTIQMVEDARNVNSDDRLLIRLWAYRASVNAVNFSFYHNGGTHNSFIQTPFGVAHNDLFGLQGGQTGEYYHLTADQVAAAGGSSGSPSASNKFVTANDPILQSGAEARRFASGAYDLAIIGTNAASTAQGDVNTALAQLATVNNLILVGAAGTYNMFFAQVPGWKSDVPVEIHAGVIVYVGNSRFHVEDFGCCGPGTTGTALGQLGEGYSWTGTGIIQSGYSVYDTGQQPNNPIYRLVADEFSAQGTVGTDPVTYNGGSGWNAAWTMGAPA